MNGQLYFSLSGHITGASGSLFLICSSGKGTSEPIWTQWVQPTRKLLFSRLSPYSYFPPGQKYPIENEKSISHLFAEDRVERSDNENTGCSSDEGDNRGKEEAPPFSFFQAFGVQCIGHLDLLGFDKSQFRAH